MTPNDALTQLQRSHRQSYNSNTTTTTPSLRRRLTRSPSPSLSCISVDSTTASRRSTSVVYSSDSDSSVYSMRSRRSHSGKIRINGNANGITHVPEETSGDENGDATLVPEPPKQAKIDWEIPRKTLHSSIGFITLTLYTRSYSPQPVIQILSASLVIVVAAEFLRFRSRRFAALYERCLGFLMRESEKNKINGVVWYLCGVLFVLVLYPLDVAIVSILILSWADTAASTIGRLYGHHMGKLPKGVISIPVPFLRRRLWPQVGFAPRKSIAGFLASTATGFLITTSFWGYFGWLRQKPPIPMWQCFIEGGKGISSMSEIGKIGWLIGVGALSGIISGVTEALDLGVMDDNLTLPIISGAGIWFSQQTYHLIT